MIGLLALPIMIMVGNGYGQDTKKDAQPPGKGANLPQGWGKLGIVGDQKKKILDVMSSYQAKMADLKEKITQLQKEEYAEAFKLLNDDQKGMLKKIAAEKADPIKDDKKK
jgi:hypothetical protein